MKDFRYHILEILIDEIGSEDIDESVLEIPPNPEMGDYAYPGFVLRFGFLFLRTFCFYLLGFNNWMNLFFWVQRFNRFTLIMARVLNLGKVVFG